MRKSTITFLFGVFIAVLAFFEFPLPQSVDRWVIFFAGVVVSFLSYQLLSDEQGGVAKHDQ